MLDIPRFSKGYGIDDTKRLLGKIGDFSTTVPTIHIAGTNGKGSVCAYLKSVFLAAGLKTLTFTSPHLWDVRERFSYCNEMMSKEEFLKCYEGVKALLDTSETNSDCSPAFFDFLFLMFSIYVQIKKPDVVILETGLGGRLDATNTIELPKVCAITEIGLDHMEYLGDTVEKIAAEKAGIIKAGIPVVFVDKPGSFDIIKNVCEEKGSSYKSVSKKDIKNLLRTPKGIDFSTDCLYYENVNLWIKSVALYQTENAMIAVKVVETLVESKVFNLSLSEVKEGLANMKWPGRMEEVYSNIYFDGAHNLDGINAFLESVKYDGAKKRRLVFSAVSDKQVEEISSLICESELFEQIYVAPIESNRATQTERLISCFAKNNVTVKVFEHAEDAFVTMRTELQDSEKGYVTGSLYLVGQIKGFM